MSENMSTPGFYGQGTETVTMADGTVYASLLGHVTVQDSPGPNDELGGGRLLPLESVDASQGHLREILAMGYELVYLNLRPGWHHVRRVP